ncbi:MAG: TonB-dependent receptor [Porticoccaceae bacterium]
MLINNPWRKRAIAVGAAIFTASVIVNAADSNIVKLNIASQPLGQSINDFARQTGLQVAVFDDVATDITAPSVNGTYAPEEALQILLANTGLSVESVDGQAYAIRAGRGEQLVSRDSATLSRLPQDSNDTAEARGRGGVEEIIVTAQKRQESMQDVPISISAFSANQLESAGVFKTDEIGDVTPGLQMSRQIGAATNFIRGVGNQNASAGDESSVAMYIDGVYYNGMVEQVGAFNNIERIEILKGPQGTLFGRNTTGGVIHVITKDPTHEKQLKVGVSAGNYETYGGNFYGSTGITENVAADLAISLQRQNGRFGENPFTGIGAGFDEHTSIRSKWLYTPSDRTTVKISGSWGESLGDIGIKRQCAGTATFGCLAGTMPLDDFHDTSSDFQTEIDNQGWGLSGRIEHSFNSFDLVSISSYKNSSNTQKLDQDSALIPLIHVIINQEVSTFSQEIQIQSNDDSKPYDWIVGGFYWNDKSEYDPIRFTGLSIPYVGDTMAFNSLDTESYAIFAQGSYELLESTKLTLGVRWTTDNRELSGYTVNPFAPPATPIAPEGGVFTYADEKDFDETTWRVALDHQLGDNLLLYVSHNRGFKSGVYNTVLSGGMVQQPVEPEILDAYEVGMKGDFFDNRLRFNISGFFYDYENIQLVKIDGGASLLLNAAEADVKGLEIEGEAVLSENLNLRFGMAYLDAEYSSFPGCAINTPSPVALGPLGAGNIRTVGDCSGNTMVRSPKYTYNLGPVYNKTTDVGTFSLSSNIAYNDGFYWEPSNRMKEDSYTIVNAEISWTSLSEMYRLRIYGKNLLDEEYSYYSTESSFGDAEAAAPPLTFGAALEITLF